MVVEVTVESFVPWLLLEPRSRTDTDWSQTSRAEHDPTVIGPVRPMETGLVLVAVSRNARPNSSESRYVGGTDDGIELLAAGEAFIITEGRTRPVVVGADAFDSFLRSSENRAKSRRLA